MQPNYCLPIIKNTKHEVLEAIQGHLSKYQYFEVWLDYIDDFDTAFIKELQTLCGDKLILLFRRQKLESVRMDLNQRQTIITALSGSKTLMDLDISQKDELEYIQKNQLKLNLITSYHNYQQTPGDSELHHIVESMKPYRPAIFKLSTQCVDEKDTVRLLNLILEVREQNLRYIVLGMGQPGLATRILGPLWGNEMSFAPDSSDEQSAPGQLTRSQLEAIFKALNR